MIRNLIFTLLTIILLMGCDDDGVRVRNPYIPNYSFRYDINLELPTYNSLNYPSNAVLITMAGVGANGIIVFNAGSGYRAYEASCPNQYPSSCSRLTISGINAICPCDEISYSLFTGLGNAQYPLKSYRIEKVGNLLIVSN